MYPVRPYNKMNLNLDLWNWVYVDYKWDHEDYMKVTYLVSDIIFSHSVMYNARDEIFRPIVGVVCEDSTE